MKFRKKLVVVDAVQWWPEGDPTRLTEGELENVAENARVLDPAWRKVLVALLAEVRAAREVAEEMAQKPMCSCQMCLDRLGWLARLRPVRRDG